MRRINAKFFADCRGMTIPEVMVSLAIITLTLLSLWEAFSMAGLSERQGLLNRQAAAVATELLDNVVSGNTIEQDFVQLPPPNAQLSYRMIYDKQNQTAGLPLVYITLYIKAETGRQWCFYTIKQVASDE